MKNNKGFSLVELIIVIAIMAVLVGVMAPQYIKYVEKSRISTDDSNASEILKCVTTALSDEECLENLEKAGGTISWNETDDTITASTDSGMSDILDNISDTLGGTDLKVKSTKYSSSTYTVDVYYVDGNGFHATGKWGD